MRIRTVAAAGLIASVALVGAACGGDDDDADATTEAPDATAPPATTAPELPPEPDPPPPPEPAPGLPEFTAGFENGLRLNSRPIPPDAGAPHGEVKNVYVNQTRATIAPDGTQVFPYPEGSIVTKTGSRGGDDAAIVAVMRKVSGADPEHGDWIFEEWSRSSSAEPYTPLASGAVCWSCHVNAESTDWVFTTLDG